MKTSKPATTLLTLLITSAVCTCAAANPQERARRAYQPPPSGSFGLGGAMAQAPPIPQHPANSAAGGLNAPDASAMQEAYAQQAYAPGRLPRLLGRRHAEVAGPGGGALVSAPESHKYTSGRSGNPRDDPVAAYQQQMGQQQLEYLQAQQQELYSGSGAGVNGLFPTPLPGTPGGHIDGVTELDQWNYDKIVDGSKAVLIWIYNSQQPGVYSQMSEVKRLGESFTDVKSVFLCKIDAQAQSTLTERLSFKPGVVFYPPGELRPTAYSGAITSDEMSAFLASNTRLLKHGQVEDMGPLAQRFMAARGQVALRAELYLLAHLLSRNTMQLNNAQLKHAQQYVKVMKKITAHGDDWLQTEIARLTRLSESGSNSGVKFAEFRARLNILREFVELSKINDSENASRTEPNLELTRAMHTARTYEYANLELYSRR